LKYKIHPAWWPLLFLASPLLAPYLFYKNESYKMCAEKVDYFNNQRIADTSEINLVEVESLKLKAVVEAKSDSDFMAEAGISYFLETEKSKILFDIAFAEESSVFRNNYKRLKLDQEKVSKLFISHLHPDHMGGIKAARKNYINTPEIINRENLNIYLPNAAEIYGAGKNIIYSPELISEDAASTGPLRANLFFSGPTEEQALVYNIKNKGAAVIIGCGHPDLETIFTMVKKMTSNNIYAVVGGLHLPLKKGRLQKAGLDLQRLVGTGKQPWTKLDKGYLDKKIEALNKANPEKILLSPHDSSDYALRYLKENLNAEIEIIKSGAVFEL